ncbi:hypothetical protein HDU76_008313 [Blyttiomyces sp. JEL0837]|nr:hypothetical protein HDU76_008313 [Blyttiomyces sp. JEL0837]
MIDSPLTASSVDDSIPSTNAFHEDDDHSHNQLEEDDGLKAPFAKNPTKGLIPLSATEVYLDRLKGWAEVVRRMIIHFESLLDQEKKLAESYTKSVKDLFAPIKVKDVEVFSEEESMQNLFKDLYESQSQRSSQHLATASQIETQILPNLRAILSEIKTKSTDAEKEWVSLDKSLSKDRETYLKLTGNLKGSLERQGWIVSHLNVTLGEGDGDAEDGGVNGVGKAPDVGKDVPRDPWLANTALRRFVNSTLKSQQQTRDLLLSQQQAMLVFEQVVIQHLKHSLGSWFSWKSRDLTSHKDSLHTLSTKMDQVDPIQDWKQFIERHDDLILVDPEVSGSDVPVAPLVKWDDVEYEGKDDTRCLIVKEGTLLRNMPGVLRGRGYKSGQYVLTSSGYLHGFSNGSGSGSGSGSGDGDDGGAAGQASVVDVVNWVDPEISVFLPDCTLVKGADPKEPSEFMIHEKTGKLLARSEKYKLKAPTPDQSDFWFDLITSLSKPPPASRNNSPPKSKSKRFSTPVTPVSTSPSKNVQKRASSIFTKSAFAATLVPDQVAKPDTSTTNAKSAAAKSTTAPTKSDLLFETHDDDDEDEYTQTDSTHPSVAAILRGRPPPADLLALKSEMVDGNSSNMMLPPVLPQMSSDSLVGGGGKADVWSKLGSSEDTLMGMNAWDDGSADVWG